LLYTCYDDFTVTDFACVSCFSDSADDFNFLAVGNYDFDFHTGDVTNIEKLIPISERASLTSSNFEDRIIASIFFMFLDFRTSDERNYFDIANVGRFLTFKSILFVQFVVSKWYKMENKTDLNH